MKHWWNTWTKYGASLLALILVGTSGYLGVQWYENKYLFDPSVDPETIQDAEEYMQYYENLKEAYKDDNVGGETPEETLEMFISALEKGNAEEASKYFILEKQKEVKQDILKGIENGGIDSLISAYRSGDIEKQRFESSKKWEFSIYPPQEEVPFIARLVLNKQTDVWKMYEL